MSLQDLTEYVPTQSYKIHEFIVHGDVLSHSGPVHSAWNTFRRFVWRKGLASFESQEPVARDAGAISETTPTSCLVMKVPPAILDVWDLGSSQILVRSEFQQAERAAVSANTENKYVFLVAGQPGIGKSVFLMWLLVRRLALGLPTVLQVREDYAVLFHEGGTSIFLELNNIVPYLGLQPPSGTPRKIWALVDSNRFLPEPATIFKGYRTFFTIEAVSPHQPHDVKWAWRMPSSCFYMKIWDFSEVIQARPFIGLLNGGPYEERELWHLYNTYGASPAALSRFSRNPDAYKDLVTKQAREMSPDTLEYALRIRESDYSSHFVLVVEPSLEQRYSCQRRVASRGVFEILWDQHIKNQASEMLRFYYFFQESPVTAPAAGWIFELRMHQLLRRGDPIHLFPIGGRSVQTDFFYDDYTSSREGKNKKILQLTGSEEHRLVAEARLDVGFYYRLDAADSHSINSLSLVHPPDQPSPTLLVFWFAWNKTELTLNEGSLRRICGFECPPDTHRCCVVVTTGSVQPQIRVPGTFFSHRGQEETEPDNCIFPAFHCHISASTLF